MNDKSTPETDRIAESLLHERADKRDYELRQHARRLECERDAERALADLLASSLLLTLSAWITSPDAERAAAALRVWKEARSE